MAKSLTERYRFVEVSAGHAANNLQTELAREAGYGYEAAINAWRFSSHAEVLRLRRRSIYAARRAALREKCRLK